MIPIPVSLNATRMTIGQFFLLLFLFFSICTNWDWCSHSYAIHYGQLKLVSYSELSHWCKNPREKFLSKETALRHLFKSTELHCFIREMCFFISTLFFKSNLQMQLCGNEGRGTVKLWDNKFADVPQSLSCTDFRAYFMFINFTVIHGIKMILIFFFTNSY